MIYRQADKRYKKYLLSELDIDTKRNWDNFRALRRWTLGNALALVWKSARRDAWKHLRAHAAHARRFAHVDVRGTTGLPMTPSPAPYAANTLEHGTAQSKLYFLALRHSAEMQIPDAFDESITNYVRFYLEHPLPEFPFKPITRQGLADVWDTDVKTRNYCLRLGERKMQELHAVGLMKWYFVTWMRFHVRFRLMYSRRFVEIEDRAPLLGRGHRDYW